MEAVRYPAAAPFHGRAASPPPTLLYVSSPIPGRVGLSPLGSVPATYRGLVPPKTVQYTSRGGRNSIWTTNFWGALHARAQSEKTSVSELVRQAVRERYIGDVERRRAAMQRFVGIRKAHAEDRDARVEVRRLRRGSRLDKFTER